ncbi:MAG: hypothetical protein K9H49_08105 [Bacteroidales bacterium]|nr:hypothetical protein [Bacteroidales bacterium]MCF8391361.1 hypothetical protein [Bacteroidales bacterium]
MKTIKFGTDGWRAIIAREFTSENLVRLSLAVSTWLLTKYTDSKVVIGYDCRFGGDMFSMDVAKTLANRGIKVILSDKFTSTPAVSLAVREWGAQLGIVITASHNPYNYNGFKLKSSFGGPLFDDDIKDIENLVNYENQVDLDLIKTEVLIEKNLIEIKSLDELYINHLRSNFNVELLKKSASQIAFDPMYGSGQNILPAFIPGINVIHKKQDFFFGKTSPEPLEKNLTEFSKYIIKNEDIKLGIAVDGDADRIALLDGEGNYIDSHHIILLLIHYLAGYKKQKGIIVTGFSSTVKVEKLAEYYRLPVKRVKIGFKQIAHCMLKEDVLVGGEESGGISVKGHMPERDGIWMALLIWEWMEETGKSLNELIGEIYKLTGKFAFSRSDLTIDKQLKATVLSNCLKNKYTRFGEYTIVKYDDLDGFKYYFNDNTWLMIRPSGTEPVLRTYAEAETPEEANKILKIAEEIIRNS